MDAGKQTASSFTSDLFGAKKTCSSSQVLSSIFSPPTTAKVGSLTLSETDQKNSSVTEASSAVLGGEQKGSTYFSEPFHYSSSLYYGAQDVYFPPQSAVDPGPTTTVTLSKDDDDDSGSASRGNWWQGSLYY